LRSKDFGRAALVVSLVALVVAQTAILTALYMRVNNLDRDIAKVRRAEPETVFVQPSSASKSGDTAATGYADEDRLREIIREELGLALEDVRSVSSSANTSPARPLQSGPDYESRRDAVAQSVDYYVSIGQITEREMSRLQQDIAQLNPTDRRAMMVALVRAINTGRLDGQL